jgi:endonuclease YncB( thermonuclease family)
MDTEQRYLVLAIRFFAILFVLCAWIGFAKVAFSQPFECVMVRVIDGDTIEVFCPSRDPKGAERIRLIGVQTPERGERHYYRAADDVDRLAGNYVTVERFGKDRYGRTLGLVESQKGCLNVEMRRRYPDTKYDRLLTKKQRLALKEKGWK